MKLNNTAIKNAKPLADKDLRLSDGEGLYLLVKKNGTKCWRLDYRFNGKTRVFSMGVYPEVPLKEAREKKQKARKLLNDGKDPNREKKIQKIKRQQAIAHSFEVVARKWHEKQLGSWTANHAQKVIVSLEKDVFPVIGHIPIHDVRSLEVLNILKTIEERGALDMARRVKQRISAVFVYAIARSLAANNPTNGLEHELEERKKKHYRSLNEKQLSNFLKDLEKYEGRLITTLACKLLIITFVRTKELINAEWEELDLDNAIWRIPAHKMKANAPHVVPLSKQALDIIEQIKPLTSRSKYLFPNEKSNDKPMSNGTILGVIKRLGYQKLTTGHGFRSTASTILNENSFNRDHIEKQLSHSEKDEVRAAYNHAEYLKERRVMMQWYSDKIDALRANESNLIIANFKRH